MPSLSTPPIRLSEDDAQLALSALTSIATTDGVLHDLERQLLESLQQHIFGATLSREPLHEENFELLRGRFIPEVAEQILNLGIVVALIDGKADESESALLEKLRDSLGIQSQALNDVEHLIDHHLRIFRIDVLRRSFIGQRVQDFVKKRGFSGMMAVGRGLLGNPHPATARRYRALSDLPEGTLGHDYHAFVVANQFSFPGEENGPPEPIVFHDCLHVLAEYGTEPEEESQIAAFQAGVMKKDSIFGLLFTLAQFQLGVQITPVAEGHTLKVDPKKMVDAYLRGKKVNRDLCVDWQPWDDFSAPVVELRDRYGIVRR